MTNDQTRSLKVKNDTFNGTEKVYNNTAQLVLWLSQRQNPMWERESKGCSPVRLNLSACLISHGTVFSFHSKLYSTFLPVFSAKRIASDIHSSCSLWGPPPPRLLTSCMQLWSRYYHTSQYAPTYVISWSLDNKKIMLIFMWRAKLLSD
jgi:hypothetical protein